MNEDLAVDSRQRGFRSSVVTEAQARFLVLVCWSTREFAYCPPLRSAPSRHQTVGPGVCGDCPLLRRTDQGRFRASTRAGRRAARSARSPSGPSLRIGSGPEDFATTDLAAPAHAGRIYHLQYKPWYRLLGEPDHRHRRAMSVGRAVERLMVLDGVLAEPDVTWLGLVRDKVAAFTNPPWSACRRTPCHGRRSAASCDRFRTRFRSAWRRTDPACFSTSSRRRFRRRFAPS